MTHAHKLVHAPHLGHDVRLGGRRRPIAPSIALNARHILRADLPAPPSSTNYRTAASKALRAMLMNDSLGDCVCAGRGHRIGVNTANAGAPFVYTDAMVLADYEAIGGYVPGDDSTDQGCDMATAANYGVSHGYADGSKDVGWLSIDATNKTEVMQMIYLFETIDFGVELPDAWISPFPSADGFVWGVAGAPDPQNGHCFEGVDYELMVHLNADQINKAMQKAPNGVDWAKLIAFFDEAGGHVPVPTPPPAPGPSPTPPPAPVPAPPVTGSTTLAEAQALVTAVFGRYQSSIVGTKHAAKIANDALAVGWRIGK